MDGPRKPLDLVELRRIQAEHAAKIRPLLRQQREDVYVARKTRQIIRAPVIEDR